MAPSHSHKDAPGARRMQDPPSCRDATPRPGSHLFPAVLLQTVQEPACVCQPERCHLKVIFVLLKRQSENV